MQNNNSLQRQYRPVCLFIAAITVFFSACELGFQGQIPALQLTGTVSIIGTTRIGRTLTANTENLGGIGSISFQWMRGTTNIGTNSSTYTVQAADVGQTITVTVTRAINSGSVTGT